jgi:hypothetical protein
VYLRGLNRKINGGAKNKPTFTGDAWRRKPMFNPKFNTREWCGKK